jgi:hypothetical protein
MRHELARTDWPEWQQQSHYSIDASSQSSKESILMPAEQSFQGGAFPADESAARFSSSPLSKPANDQSDRRPRTSRRETLQDPTVTAADGTSPPFTRYQIAEDESDASTILVETEDRYRRRTSPPPSIRDHDRLSRPQRPVISTSPRLPRSSGSYIPSISDVQPRRRRVDSSMKVHQSFGNVYTGSMGVKGEKEVYRYKEEEPRTTSRRYDSYERERNPAFGQPETESKPTKRPEKAADDLLFKIAVKLKTKAQKAREAVKEKTRDKETHAPSAKSRDLDPRKERIDKQSSRRAYVEEEDNSSTDSGIVAYVPVNRPPPRSSKSTDESLRRTKSKPEPTRKNTLKREEEERRWKTNGMVFMGLPETRLNVHSGLVYLVE